MPTGVARFALNVLLYFTVLPLAYVLASLPGDPILRTKGLLIPAYAVFAAPVFPIAVIVVPVLSVLASVWRPTQHRRMTFSLSSAGLFALIVAVATGSWLLTLLAAGGGLLYGLVFRLPIHARAFRQDRGDHDIASPR